MVLATLAGWALQVYAGVPHATVIALMLGLVGAQFVPGASCAIPGDRRRTSP